MQQVFHVPPSFRDYQGDSSGSGVTATPCRGIHGKTKSLTVALRPSVDRARWGLSDICGLKKKVSRVRSTKSARGILAAPLRPLNTSTSQPWEHKEHPRGAQFKGKHAHMAPR